jgi:hypothetical protein
MVNFAGGKQRFYNICHSPPRHNQHSKRRGKQRKPGFWEAESRYFEKGFDIRAPHAIANLELLVREWPHEGLNAARRHVIREELP